MVEGPRSLTDALLDWISNRLLLAHEFDLPHPRWPPTEECRRALEAGDVATAVETPDAPDARYVVVDHLRRDAPHLLLARDEELERDVVIKLIRAPTELARIVAAREARLTAGLRHPNIVVLHDVDPEDAYLVLERLDGDLRDLRGIGPDLLIDAYCQAGRALAAAHARGIWHLDFKPENVLVQVEKDRAGQVAKVWAKVTDFGVAQVVGPRSEIDREIDRGHASERGGQRAGGDLEDQRTFALAVWDTLTAGRRPPDGSELLPPELHAVLSRALMAEPGQRWADMTALVDAMERGRSGTAATSAPLPRASRLLEWAIAHAEDGLFATVAQEWNDALIAFAGCDAQLGEGGLALGATLLDAAAEATGPAQRRGFARSIEVLEDAARYLQAATQLERAGEALGLAATACDRLDDLLPIDSPQHERRAADLRVRSKELMTMPHPNNTPPRQETSQ